MTATSGPRLLVFGDSLSFHGPDGTHAADEDRLWPNVAAAALGGHADLVAGTGWTARDAWWALTGDPRVWADVPRADVVVFAVGSMDSLPSPLPTYLRTGLRYVRPAPVRHAAREAYRLAQPVFATLLRGRPPALPPRLTVRYLDTAVEALRTLRPDLPVVGWAPSVHRAPSYGYVHTMRHRTAGALAAWSRRRGVPLLDLPAVVGPHVLGGHGNPDGMHWGWAGHDRVGCATAELIAPLLGRRGAEAPGRGPVRDVG
ncbi:diglucosylglycerate octanoyltransferase [Saccharomonospora saliphila]|uniref:diglucosylglycerate octanoyltransferase n=1 Tax=Saccharomonospora saliphila TaxID=369829 RepID=UPI00036A0973|nr:diglucosylglycerate octanoyltransferase [Saccharomonospora saliphila]